MNSCLYECSAMHHRFTPKVHHFQHDLLMFYLDLDEVETLSKNLFLFGHNRWNIYSLKDGDHEPAGPGSLKERIAAFLKRNGIDLNSPAPVAGDASATPGRVMLLTLPRICGYIFNPISLYYCFDDAGRPLATVVEVGNTFGEMKLYLLRQEDLAAGGRFEKVVAKHFYVSPFASLELSFDFRLRIPGEKLDIKVDDRDGAEKVLISTLTGRRAELTNRNLAWFTVKYPLVTVKVIFLIHWHALRLWAKGVPFIRKAANVSLQRDVLRPHATLAPKPK